MDYEKKYNEALERAKKFEEKYGGGYAEYIFPELAESDDERIMKTIRQLLETARDAHSNTSLAKPFIDALAWLEKQKEPHKRLRDKTPWIVTAKEELAHAEERLQANLEELHRIRAEKEKQKEQKPVEYLDKDKVYAIMIKLTILSYSKLIPINSDEFKKLHEITSDVRSLLDYPIKQKPSISCGHENDAEWSEADADMLNCCISSIEEAKENRYAYNETDGNTSYDREIDWLKSLRPSWKPSEEQMNKLKEVIYGLCTCGNGPVLKSLYEDLKKLM